MTSPVAITVRTREGSSLSAERSRGGKMPASVSGGSGVGRGDGELVAEANVSRAPFSFEPSPLEQAAHIRTLRTRMTFTGLLISVHRPLITNRVYLSPFTGGAHEVPLHARRGGFPPRDSRVPARRVAARLGPAGRRRRARRRRRNPLGVPPAVPEEARRQGVAYAWLARRARRPRCHPHDASHL